jgi:hypothetical protein
MTRRIVDRAQAVTTTTPSPVTLANWRHHARSAVARSSRKPTRSSSARVVIFRSGRSSPGGNIEAAERSRQLLGLTRGSAR